MLRSTRQLCALASDTLSIVNRIGIADRAVATSVHSAVLKVPLSSVNDLANVSRSFAAPGGKSPLWPVEPDTGINACCLLLRMCSVGDEDVVCVPAVISASCSRPSRSRGKWNVVSEIVSGVEECGSTAAAFFSAFPGPTSCDAACAFAGDSKAELSREGSVRLSGSGWIFASGADATRADP